MTPDAIRALLAALGTSQRGLAVALGVTEKSVRDWISGRDTPSGPALLAMRLLAEAAVSSPTLPVEADRDGPAGEALDPHLDRLASRAEASGWQPGEVGAAVLTWVTHRLVAGVGTDEALRMLDDAGELVQLARREGA